ncbi:MAG: lysozyme [Dehalococcoidales bacterium]|nr:lysozyme [Dehalococcoidales bacterium]
MIPRNAIDLAKTFEGFSSTVYLCPANYFTIGYGHRCNKDHARITKEQALEYLEQDLHNAYVQTVSLCPKLITVNETWLGAIIDFVFNLGSGRLKASTLRKKINSEQWDEVPEQLNKWVYGGGRKLKGLVLRRAVEAMYFKENL